MCKTMQNALLCCGEGERNWPNWRARVKRPNPIACNPTILCDNPKGVLLCSASSDLWSPVRRTESLRRLALFNFGAPLNDRKEVEQTACPWNEGLAH